MGVKAMRLAGHTLATRLALLAVAFALLPAVLFVQFREAEESKRAILLKALQNDGYLIAQGLRLGIPSGAGAAIVETRALLERIDPKGIRVRLLFRPATAGPGGAFYLIAALPPLPAEAIERERQELVSAGVVDQLPASCDGPAALDMRYRSAVGNDEVLTSITPFTSAAGCWAVVTSHSTADTLGKALGRPFWKAGEVQLAAALYASLAVLVLLVFMSLWRGVDHFRRQARAAAAGQAAAFGADNPLPELAGVAEEFDRMVAALKSSAEAFRHAAEDNAHAFKTPIATIAQAVEPLRQTVAGSDTKGSRALAVIETSLARLDALVAAARRLDEANATLVHPPHRKVELSRLVSTLLDSYDDTLFEAGITLERRIASACTVWGGTDLLETVVENLVDNAISFSERASTVITTVARQGRHVVLTIEDQGPGAPEDLLPRLFERYVSHRPATPPDGSQHFGIGLWLSRRNVEAMGGSIRAENIPSGGLRMVVSLLTAD